MPRTGPGMFLSTIDGGGGEMSISSISRDSCSTSPALRFGNSLTFSNVISFLGIGMLLAFGGTGGGTGGP